MGLVRSCQARAASDPVSEGGLPLFEILSFCPVLVGGSATDLEHFTGQEPVDQSEGAATLVVRRERNIDVSKVVVCIDDANNWQSGVHSFTECLLICGWVGHEKDVRFDVGSEHWVGEGTRNESANGCVCAD